jgi:hypothetical protein
MDATQVTRLALCAPHALSLRRVTDTMATRPARRVADFVSGQVLRILRQ